MSLFCSICQNENPFQILLKINLIYTNLYEFIDWIAIDNRLIWYLNYMMGMKKVFDPIEGLEQIWILKESYLVV